MDLVGRLLADARRRRALPEPAVRRAIRQRAGLSQREIALALNVGRTTVTKYESGAREPRGPRCLAYIALLERMAAGPSPTNERRPAGEPSVSKVVTGDRNADYQLI